MEVRISMMPKGVEHSTKQVNFYTYFTGAVLVVGGLVVLIGSMMRPTAIYLNFQPNDLALISAALPKWILANQILMFGLFMRLCAVVALATLYWHSPARTIVLPGAAICAAALSFNAFAEGYYYHMGIWLGSQWQAATPAMQDGMLNTVRATSEMIQCIDRMGKLFYCLGFTFFGFGLVMERVIPRWLGAAPLLIGMAGMMILMLYPGNREGWTPFFYAITLWFIISGVTVLLGVDARAANADR